MAFMKMIWQQGTPPVPVVLNSWDYWSSAANDVLFTTQDSSQLVKRNAMICYYAVFELEDRPNYYIPICISPNSEATLCRYNNDYQASTTVLDDVYGIRWYVWYRNWINPIDKPTDANLIIGKYQRQSNFAYTVHEVATDLLDRIYAVPFHEDYQVGTEYRIPACGDVRRTIRKAIGLQLAFNVSKYGSTASTDVAYKTYSDNIDAIISGMMANITQYGNANGVIIVQTEDNFYNGDAPARVYHGHYADATKASKIAYLDEAQILANSSTQNLAYKTLKFKYDYGGGKEWEEYYLAYDFMQQMVQYFVNSDGTFNLYEEPAGDSWDIGSKAFIGIYGYTSANITTNLGVDF